MTILLVVLVTAFAVWRILLHYGVFEVSKGYSSGVSDIKYERGLNKKRKMERKKLDLYFGITDMFRGLLLSDYKAEKYMYYIERLDIRSKILDRFYRPEELRGKFALLLIVGLFMVPVGIFFLPAWFITGFAVARFLTYEFIYDQIINEENELIDNYFLDLYLLLYSKLRLGSRARIQTVVESYILTLESAQDSHMKDVMTKLAQFLLNNLMQNEDHVAVVKMRDRYKSAVMVNFCNVASQALQGIDNSDNLLTFKMALVRRKTQMMERRAEKLCKAGERAIYAIYVILFIFIGVGWYSKLPTGFF